MRRWKAWVFVGILFTGMHALNSASSPDDQDQSQKVAESPPPAGNPVPIVVEPNATTTPVIVTTTSTKLPTTATVLPEQKKDTKEKEAPAQPPPEPAKPKPEEVQQAKPPAEEKELSKPQEPKVEQKQPAEPLNNQQIPPAPVSGNIHFESVPQVTGSRRITYFVVFLFIGFLAFGYCNRKKIIGMIIEGPSSRGRRGNVRYRRLSAGENDVEIGLS